MSSERPKRPRWECLRSYSGRGSVNAYPKAEADAYMDALEAENQKLRQKVAHYIKEAREWRWYRKAIVEYFRIIPNPYFAAARRWWKEARYRRLGEQITEEQFDALLADCDTLQAQLDEAVGLLRMADALERDNRSFGQDFHRDRRAFLSRIDEVRRGFLEEKG